MLGTFLNAFKPCFPACHAQVHGAMSAEVAALSKRAGDAEARVSELQAEVSHLQSALEEARAEAARAGSAAETALAQAREAAAALEEGRARAEDLLAGHKRWVDSAVCSSAVHSPCLVAGPHFPSPFPSPDFIKKEPHSAPCFRYLSQGCSQGTSGGRAASCSGDSAHGDSGDPAGRGHRRAGAANGVADRTACGCQVSVLGLQAWHG